MIQLKSFTYQPGDHEAEKASNSYLMSLVAVIAGLPLPIVNLGATLIFYLGNRKGTYFVRWHCTQALLSQCSLLLCNSFAFWWSLGILFSDDLLSNSYVAYMITVFIFNAFEFIATIYTAVKTRKGIHVEWWLYGGLTQMLCKEQKMKKVILQFVITASIFLGCWAVLGQYDWMAFFEVENTKKDLEVKVGELMIRELRDSGKLIENKAVQEVLDSMLVRLSEANSFDPEEISIYVGADMEVNAFALPDRKMVINKGLIARVTHPEELAGVMAHELVHIRNNHVMKKLVRELGLSVMVSMASGGAGSDAVKQVGHLVSSRAFDRELEEEADTQAAQILNNSGVSAEHLANFLYLLADYSGARPDAVFWFSTHPELKARAEHILEVQSEPEEKVAIMSDENWGKLQEFAGQ